jgi:hypothetical protein
MDTTQPTTLHAGKLAIGLVLLAVGVALFLDAIDILEVGMWWVYWPVILIAIGAANAFEAIRRRRGDGSWFMIGIGVWMLVGSLELFDLSYGSAFPLAVICVGFGAVLHAIIDVPQLKKENEHERQQ